MSSSNIEKVVPVKKLVLKTQRKKLFQVDPQNKAAGTQVVESAKKIRMPEAREERK
jgi:hypothetical protein